MEERHPRPLEKRPDIPDTRMSTLFEWSNRSDEGLPADHGTWPVKVSCGLGVNSVAMLVGLKNRGERVDCVVFADTGSERPETYAYIPTLREWLASVRFPDLTIVKNGSPIAGDASLYDECHRKKVLPSPAYGGKSCSLKWKVEPQRKWTNAWPPAIEAWSRGGYVWNLIGYDDGVNEHKRAKNGRDVWPKGHWNRYPLQEWHWDRAACIAAIEAEGLPLPIKSACFMCPNAKRHEVVSLGAEHPDLAAASVELETRAHERGLTTVKGLGRRWSWQSILGGGGDF